MTGKVSPSPRVSNARMRRWVIGMLMLCTVVLTLPAQAATRAWLSREQIALGETTTLNIETTLGDVDSPDYSALNAQFEVSDHTSSRQYQTVNGNASQRLLFAVALRPRRSGVLQVPSIRVGREHTQPLSLLVDDSVPVPTQANGAEPVFIETELDARRPYVQQAVRYTARLYFSVSLRGGSFQPDPRQPDGASLREVGDGTEYTRQIGGRIYRVHERYYELIPERSGRLRVPGMHFQGEAMLDPLDRIFGADERVQARSAPIDLQVQPLPANAPQPWLPLHGLSLRYLQAPRQARVGEATTVVLEANADGASPAQMPVLELGNVDGAQVFANPVQIQERLVNGRTQVLARRTFSIVPTRPGLLRIQPRGLRWWDANAGRAQEASLPNLTLQVQAGKAAPASSASGRPASPAGSGSANGVASMPPGSSAWAALSAICALAVLALLGWWLRRRGRHSAMEAALSGDGSPAAGAAPLAPVGSRSPRPPHRHRAGTAAALPSLSDALKAGDLALIEQAWCASATPAATDVHDLRQRLHDPAQLQALDLLQQARWGGGAVDVALAHLRAALANGVRWRPTADAAAPALLPPLYPTDTRSQSQRSRLDPDPD